MPQSHHGPRVTIRDYGSGPGTRKYPALGADVAPFRGCQLGRAELVVLSWRHGVIHGICPPAIHVPCPTPNWLKLVFQLRAFRVSRAIMAGLDSLGIG